MAIEAKAKARISANDTKGLLNFKKDFPGVQHLIVVCLEAKLRRTDEGLLIVPHARFPEMLWQDEWTEGL